VRDKNILKTNNECTELSIVIPCLNEAETLADCIKQVQSTLKENHINGEIIVSDNGSTDGSKDITQSFGVRVINVAEKGYGTIYVNP